ncbi:hypothetical protein NUW54_g623 [Trametes sanguinea]|uniref:Uncharacterized protein n=1 Tax=Trametes sanguinea TaxID=158606 RepID=A0ACC1Q984_9APHY|nr:hypothetical protein NUW54_g623 [Trametes sanguinea]
MNNMNPPRQPWLSRDVDAQNRARTRLPELFAIAHQLFTHWECIAEWDTRLPFGPLHRAPGASDLRVKFSAKVPSFTCTHARQPVLKLWPTWAYANVNPTQYAELFFTRSGYPEPNDVEAASITFVRIDWSVTDIAFLPDLFRSFKSLRTLQCLEFKSCILPAEALRQLQRVISEWHPRERGPITDIKFHNCTIAIEDVHFLTRPSLTNWSVLQSLTLYSPSADPSPLEGQDRFLEALSLLPVDCRPRLRNLHYSVKDANDLWDVLGSRLPSFRPLEELTIWIREAILNVPGHSASNYPRKHLQKINITYQLGPQRAPVQSVWNLPHHEQDLLRRAAAAIASWREEGLIVDVTN